MPSRAGGTSDSHVAERVLSQFLAELDGVEELKGVLVLGATNRSDLLDPAILRPGRFDQIVEIPLPEEGERSEIFAIHLQKKPLGAGISFNNLASRTEGFSGADISSTCTRAALRAVRRAVQTGDKAPAGQARVTLEASDLEEALEEVRQQSLNPRLSP